MFNRAIEPAPPEYWAADGVHPTLAGHALMATEWRKITEFKSPTQASDFQERKAPGSENDEWQAVVVFFSRFSFVRSLRRLR